MTKKVSILVKKQGGKVIVGGALGPVGEGLVAVDTFIASAELLAEIGPPIAQGVMGSDSSSRHERQSTFGPNDWSRLNHRDY